MSFIAASLIAGGASIASGYLSGRGKKGGVDITQLPEYGESEAGRGMWWDKLQEWGGQPGYGAISPDWGDIWEQAQQRVKDYYSGTATQPGFMSKIEASAAKRGVSDSPAIDVEKTKALVSQGRQMKELASEQATKQAMFGEQGRQYWMSQIGRLSHLKPSFNVSQSQSQYGAGDMIAGVGGSVGNAMTQYNQQKWLEDLLKSQSTPGGAYTGGGGGGW